MRAYRAGRRSKGNGRFRVAIARDQGVTSKQTSPGRARARARSSGAEARSAPARRSWPGPRAGAALLAQPGRGHGHGERAVEVHAFGHHELLQDPPSAPTSTCACSRRPPPAPSSTTTGLRGPGPADGRQERTRGVTTRQRPTSSVQARRPRRRPPRSTSPTARRRREGVGVRQSTSPRFVPVAPPKVRVVPSAVQCERRRGRGRGHISAAPASSASTSRRLGGASARGGRGRRRRDGSARPPLGRVPTAHAQPRRLPPSAAAAAARAVRARGVGARGMARATRRALVQPPGRARTAFQGVARDGEGTDSMVSGPPRTTSTASSPGSAPAPASSRAPRCPSDSPSFGSRGFLPA